MIGGIFGKMEVLDARGDRRKFLFIMAGVARGLFIFKDFSLIGTGSGEFSTNDARWHFYRCISREFCNPSVPRSIRIAVEMIFFVSSVEY